jgi:hypothetical protein
MPKNRSLSIKLTPGQASYVLTRFVQDRRVTEREVTALVRDMESEVAQLEQRLAELRESMGSGARAGRASGTRRASTSKVSGKTLQSRRIQGQYMGLIRHLNPRERARIKKIALERGREAAIQEMRANEGK